MPLFYIHWNIFASTKKNCMTFFATMNEQDDANDAGKNVKILGRWHCVSKGEGWCVVEAPVYADVASFLFNWSSMCDITVESVLNDDDQRTLLMNKYSMGKNSWTAKFDRAANAEPQTGETLYHITYKFKPGCTAAGFKAFAGMKPEHDQADKGNCQSLGRWHNTGTGSGYAVCAAKHPKDVNAWAANWAELCECDIRPVCTDLQTRTIVQSKPDFEMSVNNVLKGMGMVAGGVKSFADLKKKLSL